MATLIKIVLAVFLGVMLGLIITIRSLDRANSNVVAGPWHGEAREGAGEFDPYALAASARSGLMPLGAAEGLTFIAESDSKGGALSGRCDYAVTGAIPSTRFWTLSLLTPEGFPAPNPAARYGFTSAEILRINDDPVLVTVSPEARSENWLPTGHVPRYVLMLRLYDTGLSTIGARLDAAALPDIQRLGCR
jgi:hypothetical protein